MTLDVVPDELQVLYYPLDSARYATVTYRDRRAEIWRHDRVVALYTDGLGYLTEVPIPPGASLKHDAVAIARGAVKMDLAQLSLRREKRHG